ncbi:MAG: hypothetical protein LBT94_07720 [Prevotellaceae bacterium]|nr:hypothetical protein [Prevotellaceae bacterium]
MHIANPLYDVVFKFMMEDEKVAKAFISAIIGEEVVALDFAAQERTLRRPKKTSGQDAQKEETFFTVCRFDFSAKIATPNGGFKTVLIELQKAKLSSDIMRFRRYMGLHYENPSNTSGKGRSKKARQLYCIFLLGYDIGIPECPLIQVDYGVKDVVGKKDLEVTNEFIQSLHHKSWIVQIAQLKQRRRNKVEKLLSIFDQENRVTANNHIMNVREEDFPACYHPIIRRLRMASESEDVQIEMEMEDDYMEELLEKERLVAQQAETIEKHKKSLIEHKKSLIEHKKSLIEHKKSLIEKDKVLKEKDKAIEEKDKALEEKDKAIEELKKQLAKNKRNL